MESISKVFSEKRLLSIVLILVFIYSITAFPYTSITVYHGLTERMFVAVPLLWIEVTGLKVLRGKI